MTAPARLALGVLGLLTTTTAVFARIAPPTRPGTPGSEEPPPPEDEADRVRLAGGGLGIRLREDARLALNYDNTERYSPVPSREYSRGLYATLNYGF